MANSPPAMSPTPAPVLRKYTIQPGDTLSKISEGYYGDPERYIKSSGPTSINWTTLNLIRPGMVLVIPE